jgi:iron-sulfur cluster repair protein YtfE (RIC family)
MSDLDLATRAGLPDALRVLVAEYPRAGWPEARHFDGLVAFWLGRHLLFRRLCTIMTAETQALLDRRIAGETFAARLARRGGQLVSELDGHHRIEDAHYFPLLARAEPRLAAGFDLLDGDHRALHHHLAAFADAAESALAARADAARLHDAAGAFLAALDRLDRLLARHLEDEEDLVVPVILRHGAGALG